MPDSFVETRARVAAALNDPGGTRGAVVDFAGPHALIGNLAMGDPLLSLVCVDELGRLWKEVHDGDRHQLVCIFDLREHENRVKQLMRQIGA